MQRTVDMKIRLTEGEKTALEREWERRKRKGKRTSRAAIVVEGLQWLLERRNSESGS